jgi:hypothetical protein
MGTANTTNFIKNVIIHGHWVSYIRLDKSCKTGNCVGIREEMLNWWLEAL